MEKAEKFMRELPYSKANMLTPYDDDSNGSRNFFNFNIVANMKLIKGEPLSKQPLWVK